MTSEKPMTSPPSDEHDPWQAVWQAYGQAMTTLHEQTSALQQHYASQLSCKQGCYGCCLDGFKIRLIEAVQLLNGFSQISADTAASVVSNLGRFEKNDQLLKNAMTPGVVACPLLIDGACSLYDNRPTLCRAFGLALKLDDMVATCELNFKSVAGVPVTPAEPLQVLDLAPYYDLLDDLSVRLWANLPDGPYRQAIQKKCRALRLPEDQPPMLSVRDYLRVFIEASQPPPPEEPLQA